MAIEAVADDLEKKKVSVTLKRAEEADTSELLKADICVLASPTYGHGMLQEHMASFLKKARDIDLKQKPCAVIALGDPKYEAQYHLESAVLLKKAIEKMNGKVLEPPLLISRTPVMYLKGIIPHWTKQLINKL